ncbi:Rgp1-domain-containing protein [Fistulina hepatica ATCC 64428]|uniref:Rgp1-domain-containing protein n=1 Tax=Fistulina hepatica ATCC 64428 TaxID=1128425 RepID=A0A0D7A2N6_9AGAR|nr:Rgp1-domain-containing protein [Fistulina hepatica ATCC 64428]
MSGTEVVGGDCGIHVVVSPSQSSYFAGEPFSVTITFTNIRPPATGPSKPASSRHKRSAHSISSAPLARPPTSPRTPRSSVLPRTSTSHQHPSNENTSIRKGLSADEETGELSDSPAGKLAQRRNKLLAKSLSVVILPESVSETTSSQSAVQSHFPDLAFTETPLQSPHPSTFQRSDSLPLAADHPHARKNSVLDGQLQLRDVLSPPPLSSPSASTSSFSLVLDPISEGISRPNSSGLPSSSSVVSLPSTRPLRPSHLGLGHPPSRNSFSRSAFSSTFVHHNAELILYSYAQLSGTFTLTPLPNVPGTAEQEQTLRFLRSRLHRQTIGGGSMDISSPYSRRPPSSSSIRQRSHSRSSSFSSGFLSTLLSPAVSVSPSHRSTGSFSARPGVGLGLGLPSPSPLSPAFHLSPPDLDEDVDAEAPLPTLELQPAMLAVDLTLLPGESRSYSYSLTLPDNLPPTFKGRCVKFSYELVVSICRATSGAGTGSNSSSRTMKIPIRVYNHASVRPARPYDLLWPIGRRIHPLPPEYAGKVDEGASKLVVRRRETLFAPASEGDLDDLRQYAQRLIESLPERTSDAPPARSHFIGHLPPLLGYVPASVSDMALMAEEERESGGMTGCREAVEILTRNHKKASFDVNKDNVNVAVLTLAKSAYRLGETVIGVVEINQRLSRSRVLQLSAFLETQEILPSVIRPASNLRAMRKVHAEHFSSFVGSTLRTTFALDIPSDATPGFEVAVSSPGNVTPSSASSALGSPSVAKPSVTKPGGLEWKVRLCLAVAIAEQNSHSGTEGVRFKAMERDEPRGEWGSSWRATQDIAPMEKTRPPTLHTSRQQPPTNGHAGSTADDDDCDEYDGIKPNRAGGVGRGVDYGGGEEMHRPGHYGWRPLQVETVECEVPVKVWPGNTVFKAVDVVFDV